MRGMIPHHSGALAMCAVLMNTAAHGETVDPALTTMCTDGVVPSQTDEIAEMEAWLTSRNHAVTAPCAGSTGMKGCGELTAWSSIQFERANMAMHMGMSIKFSGDPNEDFVRGMIAHHQGAIDMCKVCDRFLLRSRLSVRLLRTGDTASMMPQRTAGSFLTRAVRAFVSGALEHVWARANRADARESHVRQHHRSTDH
jgi:hypothetical protein